MSMYPLLNFPDVFPRWATDVGRVLEPSSGVKDVGWQIDDVPPARWMNWLQNMAYEWIKYNTKLQLTNWSMEEYATGPTDPKGIIYHPERGVWFLLDGTADSKIWTSIDGSQYYLDETITGAIPQEEAIAIDSTYAITCSDDGLEYGYDGLAWASISNATMGLGVGPKSVVTKYSTSNLIIVATATNVVARETTGITGGSWSAATTQPPAYPAGTPTDTHLIYGNGSTVFLLQSHNSLYTSRLYISSDDGNNWANVGTHPLATYNSRCIARNSETGRLIVGGYTSAAPVIQYSDDDGDTWTTATIKLGEYSDVDCLVTSLYYCGNDIWIAGGTSPDWSTVGLGSIGAFFISDDNGVTWTLINITHDLNSVTGFIKQIACNGQYLVGVPQGFNGVAISLRLAEYTV